MAKRTILVKCFALLVIQFTLGRGEVQNGGTCLSQKGNKYILCVRTKNFKQLEKYGVQPSFGSSSSEGHSAEVSDGLHVDGHRSSAEDHKEMPGVHVTFDGKNGIGGGPAGGHENHGGGKGHGGGSSKERGGHDGGYGGNGNGWKGHGGGENGGGSKERGGHEGGHGGHDIFSGHGGGSSKEQGDTGKGHGGHDSFKGKFPGGGDSGPKKDPFPGGWNSDPPTFHLGPGRGHGKEPNSGKENSGEEGHGSPNNNGDSPHFPGPENHPDVFHGWTHPIFPTKPMPPFGSGPKPGHGRPAVGNGPTRPKPGTESKPGVGPSNGGGGHGSKEEPSPGFGVFQPPFAGGFHPVEKPGGGMGPGSGHAAPGIGGGFHPGDIVPPLVPGTVGSDAGPQNFPPNYEPKPPDNVGPAGGGNGGGYGGHGNGGGGFNFNSIGPDFNLGNPGPNPNDIGPPASGPPNQIPGSPVPEDDGGNSQEVNFGPPTHGNPNPNPGTYPGKVPFGGRYPPPGPAPGIPGLPGNSIGCGAEPRGLHPPAKPSVPPLGRPKGRAHQQGTTDNENTVTLPRDKEGETPAVQIPLPTDGFNCIVVSVDFGDPSKKSGSSNANLLVEFRRSFFGDQDCMGTPEDWK